MQRDSDLLGADDDRDLWNGHVRPRVGRDIPERHDNGDVFDYNRTELQLYGDGDRHTTSDDHVSRQRQRYQQRSDPCYLYHSDAGR